MSESTALQHCLKRLEKARSALQRLEQTKDPRETESAWSDLIMAAASIYSKLEQGSKVNGIAVAWYGRVKNERKKDSLLSYIHHARNANEHGIKDITRVAKGEAQIRFHEPYDPAKLEGKQLFIGHDSKGNIVLGKSSDAPFSVEVYNAPTCVLVPVVDDRFGDTFPPPDRHLAQQLNDTTPQAIGRLAVAYLEKLINDARAIGI
jgi:hypothetical protein